jgi:hypothetical protein
MTDEMAVTAARSGTSERTSENGSDTKPNWSKPCPRFAWRGLVQLKLFEAVQPSSAHSIGAQAKCTDNARAGTIMLRPNSSQAPKTSQGQPQRAACSERQRLGEFGVFITLTGSTHRASMELDPSEPFTSSNQSRSAESILRHFDAQKKCLACKCKQGIGRLLVSLMPPKLQSRCLQQ